MLQSMTGFGDASFEENGHLFHVEVRSVNHRYLKTTVRFDDEYAFLEPTFEHVLRDRLSRGSVTLRFTVRDTSAQAAQDLNLAAMRHYIEQLQSLAAEPRYTIDLAALLALPGVCQPHSLSDAERDRCTTIATDLAVQALDRLSAMRRAEGAALACDLRRNMAAIAEHLDAIRSRVPIVVQEYRDRLLGRVRQLTAESNVTLAAEDLLKEVSIFAERSDISEEISRLRSHLEQFEQAIRRPEPSGRTLEFIAQEMMREANTMGSKSGDAELSRRIIEIKSAIDRIKEQVLNVE